MMKYGFWRKVSKVAISMGCHRYGPNNMGFVCLIRRHLTSWFSSYHDIGSKLHLFHSLFMSPVIWHRNSSIYPCIIWIYLDNRLVRKALANVAVAPSPSSPSNYSDGPRRGRSDRSRAGSPAMRRDKESLAHMKLPLRPETWILSWLKNEGWIWQMLRKSIYRFVGWFGYK